MSKRIIIFTITIFILTLLAFYFSRQEFAATPSSENIINEQVINEKSCVQSGKSADEYSFGKYIGPKKCCEGLEKIPAKDYEDGKCYVLFDVGTVCSECGNDICEEWENPCNCPKDCK